MTFEYEKYLGSELASNAMRVISSKTEYKGNIYWQSRLKRSLDILVATPSSFVALPIMALVGTAVLIDDGNWPPFVKLERKHPGSNHLIPTFKMRSMVPNAQEMEEELSRNVSLCQLKKDGNDPRITRVGREIRRRSLDELPQLINVTLGHLSFVGPRSIANSEWIQIDNYQDFEPYAKFISLLENGLPYGLTGLDGILGRADLSLVKRLSLGVLYGECASFLADLKIIALTVPAVLKAKGAY